MQKKKREKNEGENESHKGADGFFWKMLCGLGFKLSNIGGVLHDDIPHAALQKVLVRRIRRGEQLEIRRTVRRLRPRLIDSMQEVSDARRIRIRVQDDFDARRRLEKRHFVGGRFIIIDSLIGVVGGESIDERLHGEHHSEDELVLLDRCQARLFRPKPLVIVETLSLAIEYVQIVDCHFFIIGEGRS